MLIKSLIAGVCAGSMLICTQPERIPLQPGGAEEEARMLAQLVWGEARGIASDAEKAAVVWCVLNRVDSDRFPDTIEAAVTQPGQFAGYHPGHPVEAELLALCEDVLRRYEAEKMGVEEVGRTLPEDYLYFTGNGQENEFRRGYEDKAVWDWSLPSPYEEEEK